MFELVGDASNASALHIQGTMEAGQVAPPLSPTVAVACQVSPGLSGTVTLAVAHCPAAPLSILRFPRRNCNGCGMLDLSSCRRRTLPCLRRRS